VPANIYDGPSSSRFLPLLRNAQESPFREDARRVGNGTQVRRVTELALYLGHSTDFAGYYQRHLA